MAITPPPVVPAPEPRGLRYGLLTAANGPLDLPVPHGLGAGVRYEPVGGGFARSYPVVAGAGNLPVKTFDGADPWVDATPFLAYASLTCGAAGKTAAELEAKVRRRLANGEQAVAERGMADALSAAATALTASDPTKISSVIGRLEQWLYGATSAGYGNVGYLHAPVRVASWATETGLAVKDGTVWRTHLGTIWVWGGGYPDDGRIYISGQATVWRAPDVAVPDPNQAFDRISNQYNLLAEREYAVAFDGVAARASYVPETAIS